MARAELQKPVCQRLGVRIFLRTKASVTTSCIGWAKHAATCVRDRPHTGNAAGNHHTNNSLPLAVQAYAVRRNRRRPAVEESIDHLDELILVDGTAAQLKIDLHMRRNGCRSFERRNVLGPRIYDRHEFLHVTKVSKGLNAACCGAGSNGYKKTGLPPDPLNPLRIMRRRDGSLNE